MTLDVDSSQFPVRTEFLVVVDAHTQIDVSISRPSKDTSRVSIHCRSSPDADAVVSPTIVDIDPTVLPRKSKLGSRWQWIKQFIRLHGASVIKFLWELRDIRL